MKKFLSVIALLLVAAMLMATPMYVSAEETPDAFVSNLDVSALGTSAKYAVDQELPYHVLPGASSASLAAFFDGVVTADDPWYGNMKLLAGHKQLDAAFASATQISDLGTSDAHLVAAAIDTYASVAQDDEYVYIALRVDAPRASNGWIKTRYNANIGIGFDLDDYTKYLTIDYDVEMNHALISAVYSIDNGNIGSNTTALTNNFVEMKSSVFALEDYEYKTYNGQGEAVKAGERVMVTVSTADTENLGFASQTFVEIKISKEGLKNNGFIASANEVIDGAFVAAANTFYTTAANKHHSNRGYYTVGATAVSDDTEAFYFPTLFALDNDQPIQSGGKLYARNASNIVVVDGAYKTVGTNNGVIEKGEYTASYSVTGVKGWVSGQPTNLNLCSINYSPTSVAWRLRNSTTMTNAQYDALAELDKITYYFAEDAENIYIAWENETATYGEVGTRFLARVNYYWGIGCDPQDPSKMIFMNGNAMTTYADGKTDKLSTMKGTAKSTVFNPAGVAVPESDFPVTEAKASMVGRGVSEGLAGTSEWNYYQGTVRTNEITLSKAKLAALFGYASAADLPNTMFFTLCTDMHSALHKDGYTAGDDVDNSASVSVRTGSFYFDSTTSGTGYDGYIYTPDVIVFGSEYGVKSTCINGADCSYDVELAEDEYYRADRDCLFGDTYYKTCSGCGAKGVGYFETSEALGHAPNVPEVDEQIDQVCTRCNLLLAQATGHNHTYADSYATDGAQHWKECTACGTKGMIGAHNGTPCTVCQYGASAPSTPVTPPAETTPVETQPAETTPVETQPAETQPAETTPAETTPAETTPAETEPAETTPAETEPAATEPAETEPAATEPAETEPADEAGCAGAISFMGLALVATLGACGVIATKKKED